MPSESSSPPVPLPAATVILARQHKAELQVYLLKRHAKSGFMAGHYVFPGGILDPEDWNASVWQRHVDVNVKDLASRLGGEDLTADEKLAYGVAAIRETLEEAGVFFARCADQSRMDIEQVSRLRSRSDLPREWFINLAVSQGWQLKLSALSPWSHWITPVRMKRRYDTRFWLASMPDDQQCRPDLLETTHGLWISPAKGLFCNLSGQVPLSPPTLVTLHQLLKYQSLDDLKKERFQRGWGETIFPRLIPLDRGAVLLEPWDSEYNRPDIDFDAAGLEKAVLPAGEPFSRIWFHEGLYRPISV
jgi:8-oxo-dGTP pyrophosphatase MutT (NUDIX family)